MMTVPNSHLRMCVWWQFCNMINFDNDGPIKTILEGRANHNYLYNHC